MLILLFLALLFEIFCFRIAFGFINIFTHLIIPVALFGGYFNERIRQYQVCDIISLNMSYYNTGNADYSGGAVYDEIGQQTLTATGRRGQVTTEGSGEQYEEIGMADQPTTRTTFSYDQI